MGKLLLWVAVIAIAYFAYKLAIVSQRRSERGAKKAAERDARALQGEPMRRCAHCGVHVPASEALAGGGLHFCSEAHRDAGPAA